MRNKQFIIQVLKLLVFIIACYIIYVKLFKEGGIELGSRIKNLSGLKPVLLIISICLLMFLNWFVEALKWKYLMHQAQRLTIPKSFFAVLKGIYLSLITPNRLGDGFARVESLKKRNRSRGTYAFLVGSLAQTLGVSIFGIMALWMAPNPIISNVSLWWTFKILMTLLGILLGVFFYYNKSRVFLAKLVGKVWSNKSQMNYNVHQLNSVLAMSMGRYLVFSFQFYLALLVFDINLDLLTSQMCIAMMYLISTWVPSLFLGDLGIRESAAVAIFANYTAFPEIAFLASLLLWFINLLLPSIFGMFLFTFKKERRSS